MTDYETEDGHEVAVLDGGTMLAAINRSEIDIQISTAKQYPRSIKEFHRQAMEMATLDEETAGSMFYVLSRSGTKIEGPSIRLAEVVGAAYGNLRYGSRVVSIDDQFVTAQGACHDLEKNIAITVESKRRITNKSGKRYNDDMIQVTANAACSIALREAIFKVVPRSLFKSIYSESKLASVGKASTMAEKRSKAMEWFRKAGATDKQVLEFLGRPGVDDITLDDLITLRGLVTAIKDGETTVESALAPAEPDYGKRVRKSDLGQAAVEADQRSRVNAELQPAAQAETTEVTAEQPPTDFDAIAAGFAGKRTETAVNLLLTAYLEDAKARGADEEDMVRIELLADERRQVIGGAQ